jgi:hypothetical protein
MPPNFEEFIPGERLPDMIDVYFDWAFVCRAAPYSSLKPQQKYAIKFVRQYPRRAIIDKGMFNTPSWWFHRIHDQMM